MQGRSEGEVVVPGEGTGSDGNDTSLPESEKRQVARYHVCSSPWPVTTRKVLAIFKMPDMAPVPARKEKAMSINGSENEHEESSAQRKYRAPSATSLDLQRMSFGEHVLLLPCDTCDDCDRP